MSEYIEIEFETTDDPEIIVVITNLTLAEDDVELYDSSTAMAEGSALAQAMAYVDGINQLQIEENRLIVWKQPEEQWQLIVADVTSALKDFFL